MTELNEILTNFRSQKSAEHRKYEIEMEQRRKETKQQKELEQRRKETKQQKELEQRRKEREQQIAKVNSLLEGKTTIAGNDDYINWLEGYVRAGNLPTYSYDYPMSRVIDNFFVATDDFEIAPLFGSNSINIIVPEGVKFLGGNLGHSELYFMEGYKHEGRLVPVYNDLDFSNPKVTEVINAFREQNRTRATDTDRGATEPLREKLSGANVKDYIKWLKGYMENGNLPTHSYDYPMSRVIDNFFVATDDFEIDPLFDPSSINIIVPEGVRFLGGNLGHSELYFMEGYKHKGRLVPVYSDIKFE